MKKEYLDWMQYTMVTATIYVLLVFVSGWEKAWIVAFCVSALFSFDHKDTATIILSALVTALVYLPIVYAHSMRIAESVINDDIEKGFALLYTALALVATLAINQITAHAYKQDIRARVAVAVSIVTVALVFQATGWLIN